MPLHSDTETPEEALDALSAGIAPWLPISVLILGMGADMHTASLFPGGDRLADAMEARAPILMPMRAEGAGEPRITLTAPVLAGAMVTHVLITGPEKRAALEAARSKLRCVGGARLMVTLAREVPPPITHSHPPARPLVGSLAPSPPRAALAWGSSRRAARRW